MSCAVRLLGRVSHGSFFTCEQVKMSEKLAGAESNAALG